ncbi:MAG: hypothetical protein GY906_12780 [bacterium]|nr:hypothetical protein [bacterium]
MSHSIESIGYSLPSQYGEFMEPEVTGIDLWLILETAEGTQYIPLDSVGHALDVETNPDGTVGETAWDDLTEADRYVIDRNYGMTQVYTIEIALGAGARLSASGYTDCTDWFVCDTEAEAESELRSMYPEAFLCEVYHVTFVAYCGMRTMDQWFREDEKTDARKLCSNIIGAKRRGNYTVSKVNRKSGSDLTETVWECSEPEDSAMVPDAAGYLILETISAYPEGN